MISIKTEDEVRRMREGGRRLSRVMAQVLPQVKVGVRLSELDKLAELLIEKSGGQPSFKMVSGYHWATCINVNEGVVHGVPNEYQIKKGDIVSLDIGLFYEGWHTDMARTLHCAQGKPVSLEVDQFLRAGKEALKKAIKTVRRGNRVGDISQIIQETVEKAGFTPVRTLTGHGVGRRLHEAPQIPCFLAGKVKATPRLKPGMTLAIEVIYVQGEPEIALGTDDWTARTRDGSLAGLFEDTVVVTKKEPMVLTHCHKWED